GQAGLVLPVLVPVVDADDPVPYTVDGLGTGADDAGTEVPLPVLRGMRGAVGLVLPEVVYLLGDPALDVPPVAVPGWVGVGERGGIAERVREQQRRVRTGLLGVRCAPGLVGVLRRGASGLFAGEQRQNGVDVPLVPGVCGGTAIVGCGVGGQPVARAVGGVCG